MTGTVKPAHAEPADQPDTRLTSGADCDIRTARALGHARRSVPDLRRDAFDRPRLSRPALSWLDSDAVRRRGRRVATIHVSHRCGRGQ